jgi:hypothetical protein
MTLKKRIRLASWGVLIIGLITAAAIYYFTPQETVDPFGDPLKSRHYMNQLEIMGGRFYVIQAEFVSWFKDLWHGRQLGITIAYISVFLFLVLRFIADPIRLNAPIPLESFDTKHAGDPSRDVSGATQQDEGKDAPS